MTRYRNGSKLVSGVGILLLGAWAFCLAPAAMAQGPDDDSSRELRHPSRWTGVERGFLQPVLWQQQRGSVAPQRRGPRGRPLPPLPPQMLERLKNLPPEERDKVLENNRRFQQLPPERQEELRERLRELQELTPEQRELIEQRFAIFRNLTPRQQEKARQIYERRWRQLLPERRRALLEEFRRLRLMNQAERKQRMESDELQNQFSTEERDLLAQLIALQTAPTSL